MYFLDPQNFSSHYLHTTHKSKETHPIMFQRNCIFSTFKFIVATGKEFVPLVPAKSGSKCIAMEIFSESSKMLYLYFAHSSFFFFKANLFKKGLCDEGFFYFLNIFVIFLEMDCSVFFCNHGVEGSLFCLVVICFFQQPSANNLLYLS